VSSIGQPLIATRLAAMVRARGGACAA